VAEVVVHESVDTPANVTAPIADDEPAAVHEGQKIGPRERDRRGRGVERGRDLPIVAAPSPASADVDE
jgi:hypothetical protein